jgi:hypothetical protein
MRTMSERRATRTVRRTGRARGARIAAVASSVLSSGVFLGTVASLTPSKRDFDSRTYTTVQQATIRNLRPVMGVLLPASVLANLAMLVTTDRADTEARRNAMTGLLGPLASLLLTAQWELPINAQVMTWHPGYPPTNWMAQRNRWETVHLIRTATALIGLAGTLAAMNRVNASISTVSASW